MRFTSIEQDRGLALRIDFEDLSGVSGGCIHRAFLRRDQRPDVVCLCSAVQAGFAVVAYTPYLRVRRSGGINAIARRGQGVDRASAIERR